MQLRTRRINANGLSFAVDECGSGDAVALLLHGFPETRFSWRYQSGCLADAGWRAVAPELRGFGETSRPKDRVAYEMDRLVKDGTWLAAKGLRPPPSDRARRSPALRVSGAASRGRQASIPQA